MARGKPEVSAAPVRVLADMLLSVADCVTISVGNQLELVDEYNDEACELAEPAELALSLSGAAVVAACEATDAALVVAPTDDSATRVSARVAEASELACTAEDADCKSTELARTADCATSESDTAEDAEGAEAEFDKSDCTCSELASVAEAVCAASELANGTEDADGTTSEESRLVASAASDCERPVLVWSTEEGVCKELELSIITSEASVVSALVARVNEPLVSSSECVNWDIDGVSDPVGTDEDGTGKSVVGSSVASDEASVSVSSGSGSGTSEAELVG